LKSRSATRSARTAAILALADWHDGSAEFLDDALARHRPSDERDAALARELALGAARHGLLYDALSDRFLRGKRQPPALRHALRIGAHQLFALDRVPPHAAVAETVESLKAAGERKLVPVANAVLRKLAALRREQREGPGPLGRLGEEDQPRDLATRRSLPQALYDELRESLPDGDESAIAALDAIPHLCTRTRPGQPQPQGASVLRREGAWTWWDDPQEALRGPVADGLCVVQDRAQGEVIELARPRAGELALDLCAAPGGKSLALVDAGCRVVSADVSADKVAGMREPAARLAQNGARPALAAEAFDLVLVDAPCSNSGVLARRPEARWRYDRRRLEALERLQRSLLNSAARLVAPGGRIVYSTCSLVRRENQGIAHRLDGWRILGECTTWPDEWRGGGYAALLVRS
jgi:16S rRNA (cytosine967-C5)-methyltransferase